MEPTLSDEQIDKIALDVVYGGDPSIPYRTDWCKDIAYPFARAVIAAHEAAKAQTPSAGLAIVWPKEKSVKRRDDMSPSDALQVGIDESGDLQVSLWTEAAGYSSVEFCSGCGGGGRSPETRRALIALMVAMEADNQKGAAP